MNTNSKRCKYVKYITKSESAYILQLQTTI